MDRRTFMATIGTLGLGSVLSSCSNQTQASLKVRLLQGSIPAQILGRFRQHLRQQNNRNYQLNFAADAQLRSLFSQLQLWKEAPAGSANPWFGRSQSGRADLVTLGDSWLPSAIQQQLIQPLDLSQIPNWQTLPSRWQTLVQRDRQGNLDPQGPIWGAPYRWGTTLIAYRHDLFAAKGWSPPTDWSDLWRPELRGSLSLLDQPREVIGLTLKRLNQSYNSPDLSAVPDLKPSLQALHQQAKLYSSDAYLQPLILGDTALAVGWSNDILPLVQTNPKIRAVVPPAGTALWADLWVRPSVAADGNSDIPALMNQWIDFCWQPDVAQQLSLLSQAASPAIAGQARDRLPGSLQQNSLLLPTPVVLERSEFLQPLSAQTLEQYAKLWTEIRQVQVL